jgi:hypothetical protein
MPRCQGKGPRRLVTVGTGHRVSWRPGAAQRGTRSHLMTARARDVARRPEQSAPTARNKGRQPSSTVGSQHCSGEGGSRARRPLSSPPTPPRRHDALTSMQVGRPIPGASMDAARPPGPSGGVSPGLLIASSQGFSACLAWSCDTKATHWGGGSRLRLQRSASSCRAI